MTMNSRQEGFALAAAVLAMLVVGAIVTGGFYAASQEGQITKSTDAANMALYIAETGLNNTIGAVNARTMQNYAQPSTNVITTSTAVTYGGRTVGTYSSTIYRLGQAVYLVRSQGTVTLAGPYNGASRTLAQLIKLKKADFDNNTAFQVYGDLTVSGTSDVNGADAYPGTWSDCSTKSGTAAVTANPTSAVTTSGSGAINGTVSRQAMDSATFNVFGDMGYDEVAAMANYTYAPGLLINPGAVWSLDVCTTSDWQNWGEAIVSTNPCYTWYPIMHATGDLHISSSGSGQGILLVDGNLDITGGFTFYGVVVVRGELRSTGTGGHINGTVWAYGGGDLGSTSYASGSSLVQYSSCSIERAVVGTSKLARGYPVANRSWFDVTNVQNGY